VEELEKTINEVYLPVNLAAGIRVVDKAFHVQNVNAYDSRLKGWMQHFYRVATKYLDHYLGWRRWLDNDGSRIFN